MFDIKLDMFLGFGRGAGSNCHIVDEIGGAYRSWLIPSFAEALEFATEMAIKAGVASECTLFNRVLVRK